MVSFWPWGGEDSSPASFEKALSTLSKKIAETQARLERMRMRSRKAKVLGTLYLSFAYLVYAIVLLLVVGHKNLGAYEWTGMAGGPVLIYAARALITRYYAFRIAAIETRLNEQREDRAKTIQKLKDATKYDSTMELIEKYGGSGGRPRSRQQESGDEAAVEGDKKPAPRGFGLGSPNRTHGAPPPTANIIQRRDGAPGSRPGTPPGPPGPPPNSLDPTAEFAPNAFNDSPRHRPPPQKQQQQQQGSALPTAPEPHWYDRIFDVLLGEDETAAKSRIVLVCRSCRLVNGQAPPGTKSLTELGTWRCMACGAPNGEMDEGKRIVRDVLAKKADGPRDPDVSSDDDDEQATQAHGGVEAYAAKARRAEGRRQGPASKSE